MFLLGGDDGTHRVNQFHRDRDWREACRAAIRAALAIAAVGVTWSVSGWAQGPLMLMATSIAEKKLNQDRAL
jgi:uncharacterized membrane protein YccC